MVGQWWRSHSVRVRLTLWYVAAMVVVLHDLNLAAMFCDEILVLREGRAYAHGTPAEVVTEELIAEVYGVRARVTPPADALDHVSVRFLRTPPRQPGP